MKMKAINSGLNRLKYSQQKYWFYLNRPHPLIYLRRRVRYQVTFVFLLYPATRNGVTHLPGGDICLASPANFIYGRVEAKVFIVT